MAGRPRRADAARDGRVAGADTSAGLRRAHQGTEARRASSPAEPPIAPSAAWTSAARAAKKVDGRELRHRPPSLHAGHHAAGHAVRPRRPARRHRRARSPRSTTAARARIAGVTVVRDGDFVGVVAPTERLAAPRGGGHPRGVAAAAGQPSSSTIYDHLKKSEPAGGGRGSAPFAVGRRRGGARRGGAHVRGQLSHSLHRARAARAARRRRRMDRRQADRLDRHAAAVRRPHRARRGLPASRGSRPRDRARHRLGLRREAHRRVRDRSGAAREGGGQAGQAGVDARRRVLVGVLPAGRRDRHQGRRRRRGAAGRLGIRQLELGRSGDPDAVRRSRTSASRSIRRTRRCGRARIAGWRRRPTTTRARCTWTRSRARSASTRSSSGCGT